MSAEDFRTQVSFCSVNFLSRVDIAEVDRHLSRML